MKQDKGFSLIELLVAMAILLVVTAVATQTIIQAQHVSEAVALEANVQENLRAGMHFLVRDLTQAGEGIPEAGISIPNTAASVSAVTRPGTPAASVFQSQDAPPITYTKLPPVIPGWQLGSPVTTQNATSKAILTGGFNTDIITILYADNTLVSSAVGPGGVPNPALNAYPVTQAAPAVPVCAGVIAASGSTVTLDPSCFTAPGGPTPLAVGNLIMFHNINGTALEYITAIAGATITFGPGDPGALNATGLPNGTVTNLNVGATPTTITRVWMVTYYLDVVTNPAKPQLVRQVNYPGYPAAAPANPPQAIGEVIENLSFSYDIVGSADPVGTYGAAGAGDAPTALAPDTPFLFRAVNVYLGGRSEYPWTGTTTPQFFRNSLSTQTSIRSLSFGLLFPTPGILP
jgi:prepilin-type N-terminal cleavage/methylation domain-containing protein